MNGVTALASPTRCIASGPARIRAGEFFEIRLTVGLLRQVSLCPLPGFGRKINLFSARPARGPSVEEQR
jgi:hypothetical protein